MVSAALAILETDEQRNELADFYKINKNRFYRIAYSKLHNWEDTEDAVMDMLERIADKPNNFYALPNDKRVAYATVIVKNIANGMLRKKLKRSTESFDEYNEIISEISIEEQFFNEEVARELMEYIRAMPEALKDALLLKILYGINFSEIAKALGITETAARKRLYRAKKMIEDFLEERK